MIPYNLSWQTEGWWNPINFPHDDLLAEKSYVPGTFKHWSLSRMRLMGSLYDRKALGLIQLKKTTLPRLNSWEMHVADSQTCSLKISSSH